MHRREFLYDTAATIAASAASSLAAIAAPVGDIPIIDCHIHLFDGTRPQGAPYKGGRAFPGGVASPGMYAKIAKPLGIVGVIEIDASPWVEDNLWVLETIQPEPFMVGTLGNLQPEKPEFPDTLARYAKNPLYRESAMAISGATAWSASWTIPSSFRASSCLPSMT